MIGASKGKAPSLSSKSFEDIEMVIVAANREHFELYREGRTEEHYKRLMEHLTYDRLDGKEPYDYQQEGTEFLLKQRWAILGDDMGLGKTLQTAHAIRAFQRAYDDENLDIYIFSPNSVINDWHTELQDGCGGIDMSRVIIRSNHVNSIPHTKKLGDNPYLIVIDEAHEYKNPDSVRTFMMLPFATDDRCAGCFMLSGTPVKNGHPKDIFPLLRMARHPLGYDWGFLAAACKKNSLQFLCNLYKWIQIDFPVMLRRRKIDMLDLPAKHRKLIDYEPSLRAQEAFNQIYDQLRSEYLRRVAQGIISSQGEILSDILRLRRAASWAKIEGTILFAKNLLTEGSRGIVIFCEFKDSASQIAAHFNAPILNGDTSRAERQAMIDDFQNGRTKVIVCTFRAGGVGVTLTRGTSVILHDRDWTASICLQAEDRIWRIGQDSETTSYWMQSVMNSTNIDQRMDQRIMEKNHIATIIEEGNVSKLKSIEDMGNDTLKTNYKEALSELLGMDERIK